jgi:hypothetical protein
MPVMAIPKMKRARLSIKVSPQAQDAGNPDADEDCLVFIFEEEPDRHAQNETQEGCGDKKVSAFHVFSDIILLIFSFRVFLRGPLMLLW